MEKRCVKNHKPINVRSLIKKCSKITEVCFKKYKKLNLRESGK